MGTIAGSVLLTVSRDWLRDDDGFGDYREQLGLDALRRYARLLCPTKPAPGGGPVLIHGDEPRGDKRFADIWEGWGLPVSPHPARWSMCGSECPPDRSCRRRTPGPLGREFCALAGPRRNAAMVALRPTYCVALIRNNSSGASGCADLAERAGIKPDRIPFP